MKKISFLCLLPAVVVLTLSTGAFAQTFTVKNLDSDNFVEITWDYSNAIIYEGCDLSYIDFQDACEDISIIYDHFSINSSNFPIYTAQVSIGPNVSRAIKASYFYNCQAGGDIKECKGLTTVTTKALFPPKNVQASDGYSTNEIKITWSKGTDLPESDVTYAIYRDGAFISSVSGSTYEFVDGPGNLSVLLPNTSYEYAIQTVTAVNNNSELSAKSYSTGTTVGFTATDGEYFARTALVFTQGSQFADKIKITRTYGSTVEEIAILDAAASSYNDYTGIPGYNYGYVVTYLYADGSEATALFDFGYSKPNGVVSGTVKTLQGVGIPNVNIEVTPVGGSPYGGPGTNCSGDVYCTTTDGAGYFEIDEIYYSEKQEFEIVAAGNAGQIYSPASVNRTLTLDNRVAADVNFIDLTSYTLSGKVTYASDACGVSNVAIYVNGLDQGIRTAGDGTWNYVVSGSGAYNFEPRYADFAFQDAQGQPVTTLSITGDTGDIDFTVSTERKIEIITQGGCDIPLGTNVKVELTHDDPCFTTRQLDMGATGELILTDLPPRDGYHLRVLSIENPFTAEQNILDKFSEVTFDVKDPGAYEKIKIERTLVDKPEETFTLPTGEVIVISPASTETVTTVDTLTEDFPTFYFIYHGDVLTEIDFKIAGAEVPAECIGTEFGGIPIVQRAVKYPLEIQIYEELGNDRCPVDQGELLIYDEVSDLESTGKRVPIVNGIAHYDMVAGEPNATEGGEHSYQKFLFLHPDLDASSDYDTTIWIIVEGFRNTIPEFVTTTPEIPQLILHDPPGDNSYAFVEKGTTISTFIKTNILTGSGSGSFESLSVGGQLSAGPSSISAGSSIEMSASQGTNESQEEGLITTITFTENFATSSLENFTGESGDVYVGSALNLTYDIATEVAVEGCAVVIDSSLIYGLLDFNTTFIYTEGHIKNALLPQLQTLMSLVNTDTDAGKREYNEYLASYNSWVDILEANASNRDNTTEAFLNDENISISAGATLSKTYTVVDGIETSSQFEIYMEDEYSESVDADISTVGLYLETSNGSMITSSYEYSELQGESTDVSRTIGYVIEDNDIGDAITFNVYRDPDYDTPIFKLLSGRTSCPYEEGTAPRDQPGLSINPTAVNNIPFDGAGEYRCRIENNSSTGEAREYHVRVVSTTNPDGAIVRLAGNIINNSPVSVFVGSNNYVDMILTVERGPTVDNYQDIQIMVYPPCEYELWQDGGNLVNADTLSITANFESQCTQISLQSPGDNWIVNQASNNELPITIGGYDLNNDAFESVTVWLKKGSDGYQKIPGMTIPKDQLTSPYDYRTLDLSAYPDGNYQLRVSADCNGGNLISYSNEAAGIIDRNSLAPFGIPSPSDGFLQFGQEIKVTFDRTIDPNDTGDAEVTLTRDDTGQELDISWDISGNTLLILPDDDLFSQPDLAGVQLNAHVHKLKSLDAGNVQEYPVDWSFLVNVEPVFWDPEIVSLTAPAGQAFEFEAVLKNVSLLPKIFSLDEAIYQGEVSIPDWLTPQTTDGTILPNGESKVKFTFDTSQLPGIYQGKVVAIVEGQLVSLSVIIEYLAETINWSVDPSQYQYNMNMVVQFEVVPGSNNYSKDKRDRIAAFVNGEVRGLTNIEYLDGPGLYRAFLTVYSDVAGGGNAEDIEFRFWTALDGREYGAVETVTFAADAVVGSISSPFILHPAGNFQEIPLRKGWNLISINVTSGNQDRAEIFKSIMNKGNDLVVKSLSQNAEYTTATGWQGSLKNISTVGGYMVYLSDHADTLRIVGNPVALPQDLGVVSGWNWIGYPAQEPALTGDVLQDLTPQDGDIIKSLSAFATFDGASAGWLGSLATMGPGQGYKLKLGNSGTLTYRGDPYQVDPHRWEYNMIVTAELIDPFLPKRLGEDWIIGAFVEGECRGVGHFTDIDLLQEERTFIMIYGQPGDFGKPIRYKLKNTRTGEELDIAQSTNFSSDGLIGMVLEPFTMSLQHLTDELSVTVSPNPVIDEARLTLATSRESKIKIELSTMNGKKIRTLIHDTFGAGSHIQLIPMGDLPGGMYLLQFTDGISRKVMKIVKH